MKPIHSLALVLLATIVTSRADLLVYEPFDYAPHNHETFGRVDGRNGGSWGTGFPDWDGMVDNQPLPFLTITCVLAQEHAIQKRPPCLPPRHGIRSL